MYDKLGWRYAEGALVETKPATIDDLYCHLRFNNCPSQMSCCGKAWKPFSHTPNVDASNLIYCGDCKRSICPACRKVDLKVWEMCPVCRTYHHLDEDL